MSPFSRHRAVAVSVASNQTPVIEVALGACPAGGVGITESDVAQNRGVNLVLAVEGDIFPIDEIRTTPARRATKRVRFEQNELAPA
jgi:hypothetical protein